MPSEGARRQTKYAPIQSKHMGWLLRAACRGVPMKDGHSIFFPKIVKSPGRPTKGHHEAPLTEFYQEAIALCSRCPVINECRTEYTRDPIPKDGMYFGKTPSQRTRIHTEMNQAMLSKIKELIPCGLDYIEDHTTQEAQIVNSIHKILYGTDLPGYPDGYWG